MFNPGEPKLLSCQGAEGFVGYGSSDPGAAESASLLSRFPQAISVDNHYENEEQKGGKLSRGSAPR
jgi:hypothetical protein